MSWTLREGASRLQETGLAFRDSAQILRVRAKAIGLLSARKGQGDGLPTSTSSVHRFASARPIPAAARINFVSETFNIPGFHVSRTTMCTGIANG
jgi:hypothetical protein